MSTEKADLARAGTMQVTAKEGKALVGDKLGDTRAETKTKSKKGNMSRATTIDKVTAEAKLIYGDLPKSGEGRSLRKRAAPAPAKAPLKKKGTMQATAKEGKAFLKRGRPGKKADKKADKKEEKKEESEDED